MVWRDIGAAVRGRKPSGLGRAVVVVSVAALVVVSIGVLAVGSSPVGLSGLGHPASGRLIAVGPPTAARG